MNGRFPIELSDCGAVGFRLLDSGRFMHGISHLRCLSKGIYISREACCVYKGCVLWAGRLPCPDPVPTAHRFFYIHQQLIASFKLLNWLASR